MIRARITHDRKWGRYATVWIVRLKERWRTSLSSSARTIGIGQAARNLATEMRTVLRSTYQNSGSWKKKKL